jgi:hypothetical protein
VCAFFEQGEAEYAPPPNRPWLKEELLTHIPLAGVKTLLCVGWVVATAAGVRAQPGALQHTQESQRPQTEWIEQPREQPVDANEAAHAARVAATGGPGAHPWLTLSGGALLEWLAWRTGADAATGVRALAPSPQGSADGAASLAWHGARAFTALGVAVAVVLAWAGAAAAAGVGVLGWWLSPAARAAKWMGSAGTLGLAFGTASLVTGGAALLGGLVCDGMATGLAAWARQTFTGAPLKAGLRPLTRAHSHVLLATTARAAMDEGRWREALPGVGPAWAASVTRKTVVQHVKKAREIAGHPRILDPLQRDVDLLVISRAVLLAGAHVMGALGGSLWVTSGLFLVGWAASGPPTVGGAWGMGIGVAALGAVCVLVALGAAFGAQAALAFGPGWIAQQALRVAEQSQPGRLLGPTVTQAAEPR